MRRCSRRTVFKAIDVLNEHLSQAATSQFLLELGPEVYRGVREEEVSVRKRMNDLMKFVDDHPAHNIEDGLLETAIIEKAVALLALHCYEDWWSEPDSRLPHIEEFKRALQQDGLAVSDGALLPALPADVGLPSVQSELMILLRKHGLETAEGHLDQALNAHVHGKWASANGQIRTFLEAVLDWIAMQLDPTAVTVGSGQPRRTKLSKNGFLSNDLNEWDNDGKGFINGLIRRLHPQGAHPGLSDEDDCTFRLHIVLITVALLLRRYDQIAPKCV